MSWSRYQTLPQTDSFKFLDQINHKKGINDLKTNENNN